MPGIGKNTRRLVAYVKKETEQAIQKEAKSEGTSTGKVLDAHFTQMKTPDKSIEEYHHRQKPKATDIVEITGNLSPDLLAMSRPRLGQVKNVNGSYILVRPEGKTYDVDFLENEVRFYKHFGEKEDGK